MGCYKVLDKVNNAVSAIKSLTYLLEKKKIGVDEYCNEINCYLVSIKNALVLNCSRQKVDQCSECWIAWMKVKHILLDLLPGQEISKDELRNILSEVDIG